ncbi:MAG: hypothetical protein ACPGSB_00470 [Opitutales bacterium]
MPKDITNYKRLKVKHPKKRPVLFAGFIGFTAILFGTAIYTIYKSTQESKDSGQDADSAPAMNIAELTEPEVFRQAYLNANGGLDHLQTIQSLRYNGYFINGEQKKEFYVLKRRPEMLLMTFKVEGGDRTYGYKGGEFWMRLSNLDEAYQVAEVPEALIEGLERSVDMFGPLLTIYLQQKGRVLSIKTSEWEEQECLLVKVDSPNQGGLLDLYVNPEKMQIMAQITQESDGRESLALLTDYQDVNQLAIPFMTTVKVESEIISQVVIEDLQFNIGTPSSVFEK